MIHALALALCLLGFAALAFAMNRQQRDILKKRLPRRTAQILRAVGTAALLIALWILVAARGWALGLVMFSGHTSLAAGILYCVFVSVAAVRNSNRLAQSRSAENSNVAI